MTVLEMSLSDEQLTDLVRKVLAWAEIGAQDEAWEAAQPLVRAQLSQVRAARALVQVVAQGALSPERRLATLTALFDAHHDDRDVVGRVGISLEAAVEPRFLNAAPPRDPLFERVASRLLQMADEIIKGSKNQPDDPDEARRVLRGLSTAAQLLGRSWDAVAEQAHLWLLEIEPERWQDHFDLGLFYKTRGRFKEGMVANQCAAALGGQADDPVLWNVGICATGARESETAIHFWKKLGLGTDIGRCGLPEATLPQVKVRLAERPLAERGTQGVLDDPGREETVWVERLSPCHGVIRSALLQDIGLDYGDVVLFDGVPIMHQKVGEAEVRVFPHLVTLERRTYGIYRFAGTQVESGQIAALSDRLPDDGVLFVNSEQVVSRWPACWQAPHVDHDPGSEERRIVVGKLCVPPDTDPKQLLALVDEIVEASKGVELLVPTLSLAAGNKARAEVESRRMGMVGQFGLVVA